MSVALRILRTWRDPRGTMRAMLADGEREDRALAVLIGGCLLAFVAQWPALARAAHFDPTVPLDARMGGALMATLFFLPPLAYGLAALSHLAARAMGGRGTWFGARLALFWSFLAVTPVMLMQGLVSGFVGSGPATAVVGVAVLLAFLFLWISALAEAESTGQPGKA